MPQNAPQNGHAPLDEATDLDILSPAVEELHTRLLEDGAAFRAELPDITTVTRHALLLVAPNDAINSTIEAGDEPESELEISRVPLSRAVQPTTAHPNVHIHIHRLTAVAAMLTIVGLLAALFVTLAPGRLAGGPTRVHPTATIVSYVTGSAWQRVPIPALPHALDPTGGLYIAAPGDPSMVYYLDIQVDPVTGYTQEQLSRLVNSQSWVSLSVPLPDVASAPASENAQKGIAYRMDVMPSDPMALILSLDVLGTATCPIANPVLYTCDEYLYSADGGAHWGPLGPPGPGLLAQWLALDFGTVLQPYWTQDGRLYTTLSTGDPTNHPYGTRIVFSTDNGATWQYSDPQLVAGGRIMTEFVPAPHGQTVYAITDEAGNDVTTRTLWRSDDGGVHFRAIGGMPGSAANGVPSQAELIGVGIAAGLGSVIVYRDTYTYRGTMTLNDAPDRNALLSPEFSTDGGQTWKSLPLAGLPRATGRTPYTVGTLADGSLVVVVPGIAWEQGHGNAPAKLTFYAWKPGSASWRQLTPTISNIQIGNTVTPSWWLIPDTTILPAWLCVSGGGGGILGSNWGIACSILS